MKEKLLIGLIVAAVIFGHLYQKIKIVILAYQISAEQAQLVNLQEDKSSLVRKLCKEVNLASINKKVSTSGLALNYPRQYVKISTFAPAKQASRDKENVFAKVFGFTSLVKAEP